MCYLSRKVTAIITFAFSVLFYRVKDIPYILFSPRLRYSTIIRSVFVQRLVLSRLLRCSNSSRGCLYRNLVITQIVTVYKCTGIKFKIPCIGLCNDLNLVVDIIYLNCLCTEYSLFTAITISVDILCCTYLFLSPLRSGLCCGGYNSCSRCSSFNRFICFLFLSSCCSNCSLWSRLSRCSNSRSCFGSY